LFIEVHHLHFVDVSLFKAKVVDSKIVKFDTRIAADKILYLQPLLIPQRRFSEGHQNGYNRLELFHFVLERFEHFIPFKLLLADVDGFYVLL